MLCSEQMATNTDAMMFVILQNSPVGVCYSWALFKSISHMLCIGYGRFPPMNLTDAWLTIVSMLIGASFYALFIAHISSHVLTANSATRHYDEKVSKRLNLRMYWFHSDMLYTVDEANCGIHAI